MLGWLRPSTNERGVWFGLTWSAAGFLLAVTGLSSCSYLIPEDERPPRYNTVLGPRHAPVLNHAVGENTPDESLPTPQQIKAVYGAAPVPGAAPQAAPGQAPVASFTPNAAAIPVAPSTAQSSVHRGVGVQATQERSLFEKGRDWIFGDDAEIGETPVPVGAPLPPGAKDDTQRNTAQQEAALALGLGRDYPDLETVPETPEGEVTHNKLEQARKALEIDKARAEAQKDALSREVDTDESLLKQYRDGTLTITPSQTLQEHQLVPEPEAAAPKTVNIVRGTQSQQVAVE